MIFKVIVVLEFRQIQINDKELIEKYLKLYDFVTCYYSFVSMYLWKDYYKTEIAEQDGILYIKTSYEDQIRFYIPLSDKSLAKGINMLKEYTKQNNIKLKFIFVEEKFRVILENEFEGFIFEDIRDRSNYIYATDDLANLQGKKFKQKRNFVNSFKTNNLLDYKFEEYDTNKVKDYITFFKKWYKQNEDNSESMKNEKLALRSAIEYFNYFNMIGGVLYLDGEIIAITMGKITNNILDVHFEKADSMERGAYQMINYLFANLVLGQVEFINREEDLGHPGLRKAKLSYNPIMMGNNYDITYNE